MKTRKRRPTRKDKEMATPKKKGESKYAQKRRLRRRLARRAGLPFDATFPEIWAAQEAKNMGAEV